MARHGEILARQFLTHYQNAGLEIAAGELVDIWLKVRAHPSVFEEVAREITTSDPIDRGDMVRAHVRRYGATDSSATTKSPMGALKKFAEFQKSREEPTSEWDSDPFFIFPGLRRSILVSAREKLIGRQKAIGSEKNLKPMSPTSSLPRERVGNSQAPSAIYFNQADLRIINAEAREWGKDYGWHKRQST